MRKVPIFLLVCACAVGASAAAQILPGPLSPGVGGSPGLPSPLVRDLPTDRVTDLARETVREVDRSTRDLTSDLVASARKLTALVRANPKVLDVDDRGQAVVRGEVLAISPSAASLERLAAAGFSVARREGADGLGLELVVLTPPKGMSARAAMRRLGEIDPGGAYDFNHLYADAGGSGGGGGGGGQGGRPTNAPLPAGRVGLLDGGVDAGHPAFRGVSVQKRGFAPGAGAPSRHGTATASLLVGQVYGSLGPGSELLAADVYGKGPTGGSAASIVGALNWMAQARAPVVNISLVGPDNATLRAAVRALQGRGTLVVAAVGNDGPAAPPLYPASYPGVVAVTGVDARGRLLPEAGRAAHVDFAALGAGVRAATSGGGSSTVRGTSYAAPIVASRLAARPDLGRLASEARDLGAAGPDALYGKGLIAVAGANPR
jgi:hypothetical protein